MMAIITGRAPPSHEPTYNKKKRRVRSRTAWNIAKKKGTTEHPHLYIYKRRHYEWDTAGS